MASSHKHLFCLILTFRSYKKLRTSFTDNYKCRQNFDLEITISDKSQA